MASKGTGKKRGRCGTILWVIIILGMIGAVFGDKENSKTPKQSTESVPKQDEVRVAQADNTEDKDSDNKNTEETKPTPVAVEDSEVLYYMDLYNNFEDYTDKYVTVSAPVHYAKDDTVDIKGDIEGATGMINITLLEPRTDLKEGDYITVTGRIDGKAIGYLYMKDANISATGSGSAEIYNQQKADYDIRVQQENEAQKAEFITSCQMYGYDELIRYPDTYKNEPIKDTLIVEQVMPGGFISSEGYRCYEAGTENEVVITDDRETKEPKFIEGDTITVYGTYYGTTKMTRLLTGEEISIPCIEFQYADLN